MNGQDVNREFDAFRRERNMRRAQRHSNELIENGGSDVVSQIEASERRQVADARLLREMHDFFEGATRTAAGILQQVSHEAEHETAARLRGEMQDFLSDVLRRADAFMHSAGLPSECGPNGEAVSDVAAKMQNLVGPVLDEFRHESNVGGDKHIGVDPFRADPGVFAEAIHREVAPTLDEAGPLDDAPLDPTQPHVPLVAGTHSDLPLRSGLAGGAGFGHTLIDETAIESDSSADELVDDDLDVELELVDSLGGFEEAEPMAPGTTEPAPPPVEDHDEIEDHLVADLDLETRHTPLLEQASQLEEPQPVPTTPSGATDGAVELLLGDALKCPQRARIMLKAMVQTGVLSKNQARDLYRQACAASKAPA